MQCLAITIYICVPSHTSHICILIRLVSKSYNHMLCMLMLVLMLIILCLFHWEANPAVEVLSCYREPSYHSLGGYPAVEDLSCCREPSYHSLGGYPAVEDLSCYWEPSYHSLGGYPAALPRAVNHVIQPMLIT
jgi:hypothetical protein